MDKSVVSWVTLRDTLLAGGRALAYVPRFDPRSVLRRAGLLIAVWTVAGCDESLPPRLEDPNAISVDAKIFTGRITVQGGVVGGNAGVIEASVSNIYTEVLQDTPTVNIRCRIWLADYPDSAGTATIDISSLTNPKLIQNGMLTLLPHASAQFDKHWDYRSKAGTPFWSMLQLKDTADTQGPYRLSEPVEVLMSDTVRIFKELPDYTLGPRSFTLQFEVR
jgi:hypothetical protein